jgi:hypothetical protein
MTARPENRRKLDRRLSMSEKLFVRSTLC